MAFRASCSGISLAARRASSDVLRVESRREAKHTGSVGLALSVKNKVTSEYQPPASAVVAVLRPAFSDDTVVYDIVGKANAVRSVYVLMAQVLIRRA